MDGLSAEYQSKVKAGTAKSNNFIAEYFYRPDEFYILGEDLIMACRYFGCSICAEDTIESVRQHFDMRGYGLFVTYKANFTADVIMKGEKEAWKGLKPDDEIIHKYVGYLISFVLKHGHRILFPTLIKQMMGFTIKDRTKFDAVVAAGFTLLGAEKIIVDFDAEENRVVTSYFPQYSQDGNMSRRIESPSEPQLVTVDDDDDEYDDY